MAPYKPRSLDELNSQYDKVKSAEQAIKQGKNRLAGDAAAGQGAQRVTWNFDPAKYRMSKEDAAALNGSVDSFIKSFSQKSKPQQSAMETAQAQLDEPQAAQTQLREESTAAFDALLDKAKQQAHEAAARAREEQEAAAQYAPVQETPAEPEVLFSPEAPEAPAAQAPAVPPVVRTETAAHHTVYQSADAPVKEGELSGLMEEYMRVMNDEEEDEGGRFRRRRKDRKRAKAPVDTPEAFTPPAPPMPTMAPIVPPAPVPYRPAAQAPVPAAETPAEDPFADLEIIAPVEDEAFDEPEIIAPVEDEAFDEPEIIAPVEDEAFDEPEIVAPVEDEAFDEPEIIAPVEDEAFDEPEIVAPVEDETFDEPEIIAPVEDEAFDEPEIVAPVEDETFDEPEIVAPVEVEPFDFPEVFIIPDLVMDDAAPEVLPDIPAEEDFDAPEVVAPVEDEAFDTPEVLVPEEAANENDADPDAVLDPRLLFAEEDAPASDEVQMVDVPEELPDLPDMADYPTQFEDVRSYSGDVDPEDQFSAVLATAETQSPAADDAQPPAADAPETDDAADVPAAPKKKKKKRHPLRAFAKFIVSLLLIVSLLATVGVVLVKMVFAVNTGTPAVADYYLFTAAFSYDQAHIGEGDLVLCQARDVIANGNAVVYIDEESHSFSFGVVNEQRIDDYQNKMLYDVSGVTVSEDDLLASVVQTVPQVGAYLRIVMDQFVMLLCACAAADVIFILLLVLLGRRKSRDADAVEAYISAAALPQTEEAAAEPFNDDLFSDIG